MTETYTVARASPLREVVAARMVEAKQTIPHFRLGTATVARATLSVDHRAIDGAVAAAFLSALRQRVEQPGHMRSSIGTVLMCSERERYSVSWRISRA